MVFPRHSFKGTNTCSQCGCRKTTTKEEDRWISLYEKLDGTKSDHAGTCNDTLLILRKATMSNNQRAKPNHNHAHR